MKIFLLRITATNEDKHESDPENSWKLFIPETFNGNVLQSGGYSCNQISKENLSKVDDPDKYFVDDKKEKIQYTKHYVSYGFTKDNVQFMTCAQTTLCLLSKRKVLQWGITLNSECKDSLSPDYFPSSPFYIYGNIEGQHPVAKIACGKNFCILSDVSGQVFTWGGNEFGQLGHGDKMSKSAPQIVNHLKNEFIVI